MRSCPRKPQQGGAHERPGADNLYGFLHEAIHQEERDEAPMLLSVPAVPERANVLVADADEEFAEPAAELGVEVRPKDVGKGATGKGERGCQEIAGERDDYEITHPLIAGENPAVPSNGVDGERGQYQEVERFEDSAVRSLVPFTDERLDVTPQRVAGIACILEKHEDDSYSKNKPERPDGAEAAVRASGDETAEKRCTAEEEPLDDFRWAAVTEPVLEEEGLHAKEERLFGEIHDPATQAESVPEVDQVEQQPREQNGGCCCNEYGPPRACEPGCLAFVHAHCVFRSHHSEFPLLYG